MPRIALKLLTLIGGTVLTHSTLAQGQGSLALPEGPGKMMARRNGAACSPP